MTLHVRIRKVFAEGARAAPCHFIPASGRGVADLQRGGPSRERLNQVS